MPKIYYTVATEVADIARELIKQDHPHLLEQTIVYVFRSEHAEVNGKVQLGKAKRVTGLTAFLAFRYMTDVGEEDDAPSSFFLMEIARDTWNALEPSQRVALVDHELCHFYQDGSIRPHDVEEFRQVIERHGLWMPNLEAFAESMAQQKLFPKELIELADNPKRQKMLKDLIPKKGSGIDSVTFSRKGANP